ncbi:hypothetical protein Bcen2424_5582 [Burkholderia cenocepacia HI2424]|nr:hypothetical protein Bcen2424_5582 [Burkholderia cenocepacia HI2424]
MRDPGPPATCGAGPVCHGAWRIRRSSRPIVGAQITPLARIGVDAGILTDALFGAFDIGTREIVPLFFPGRVIAPVDRGA